MPIVNRQTVIIHKDLAGPLQEFYKEINLDFEPTTLIVRQLTFYKGTATSGLHGIIVPFTNAKDGIITSFNDYNALITNPNSHFIINHPSMLFNGDVLFKIRKLTDGLVASTATGTISIELEFIREEYQEPKPVVADMTQLINFLKSEKASQSIYPFYPIGMRGGEERKTPPVEGKLKDLEALEEQPTPETEPFEFVDVKITDSRNPYDQGEPPIPDIYKGRGLEPRHFDMEGEGMTGEGLFGKLWKKVKKEASKAVKAVKGEAEQLKKDIKSGVKDAKDFIKDVDVYLSKPDLYKRLGQDVAKAMKKAEDEIVKAGKDIKKSAEAGTLLSDGLKLAADFVREYGDEAAGMMASSLIGSAGGGFIAKQLGSKIADAVAGKGQEDLADILLKASKKAEQEGLGHCGC